MKKEYILLAALLIVLSSGCISSEQRGFEGEMVSAPAQYAGAEDAAKSYAVEADFDSVDRKLILRGRMGIEVSSFDAASTEVAGIAEGAGGFVSGSNSYVTSTGRRRGSITLRVPEEGFFGVVEGLEGIGEVESKSVSSEDVTEEFIDLEARLGNLKRQEERLLEIFDKAETVEDILKVEEQLGRVRGDIESLTGRLRYLENQVSLSTISVELFEPEPITQSFGLRDSIRGAVDAFIGTTSGIIVFVGFILPILALILVALVLVKKLRRR